MWWLMSDFTLIFDWNFTRKMVLCVLLPKSLPVCEKCNSLAVISSKQYKPSPRDDTHRLLRPKITVAKVKFKLLFCQFNSIPPNLIYLLLCCQVFFWLQHKLFFRDKKCQFSPISVPHSLLQHFWITRQLLYENHFVCSTGRYFKSYFSRQNLLWGHFRGLSTNSFL